MRKDLPIRKFRQTAPAIFVAYRFSDPKVYAYQRFLQIDKLPRQLRCEERETKGFVACLELKVCHEEPFFKYDVRWRGSACDERGSLLERNPGTWARKRANIYFKFIGVRNEILGREGEVSYHGLQFMLKRAAQIKRKRPNAYLGKLL